MPWTKRREARAASPDGGKRCIREMDCTVVIPNNYPITFEPRGLSVLEQRTTQLHLTRRLQTFFYSTFAVTSTCGIPFSGLSYFYLPPRILLDSGALFPRAMTRYRSSYLSILIYPE